MKSPLKKLFEPLPPEYLKPSLIQFKPRIKVVIHHNMPYETSDRLRSLVEEYGKTFDGLDVELTINFKQ